MNRERGAGDGVGTGSSESSPSYSMEKPLPPRTLYRIELIAAFDREYQAAGSETEQKRVCMCYYARGLTHIAARRMGLERSQDIGNRWHDKNAAIYKQNERVIMDALRKLGMASKDEIGQATGLLHNDFFHATKRLRDEGYIGKIPGERKNSVLYVILKELE